MRKLCLWRNYEEEYIEQFMYSSLFIIAYTSSGK